MRRIKVLLAVVAAVATMMVMAAPVMADDFNDVFVVDGGLCCGVPLLGDGVVDGDVILVLDRDAVEDLRDARADFIEDVLDEGGVLFLVPIDNNDDGRVIFV